MSSQKSLYSTKTLFLDVLNRKQALQWVAVMLNVLFLAKVSANTTHVSAVASEEEYSQRTILENNMDFVTFLER